MKTTLRATLGALVVLTTLAASPGPTSDGFHFALDRSEPEAESTVDAPERITLWFTQVPQDGSTSIRLLDASEELVGVGEVTQGEDDPTSFSVTVSETLAPGGYTVAWRGMGADGHVVRDTFGFTVAAH